MAATFSSRELAGWIRSSFDSALEDASAHLMTRGKPVDLHEARKQLKRARAELRLLREVFGETQYRKLNTALRDSARPLSDARDAQVLVLTLKSLAKNDRSLQRKLAPLLRGLRIEQSKHETAAVKRVVPVRKRLERLRSTAKRLRAHQSGWPPIAASLKRTYRRGRKALILAKTDSSPENLHEWRKQVKYYFHQLEVLERLAPRYVAKRATGLHTLADHLGDDHDLFVLRARISRTTDEELDDACRLELTKRIDRKRRKLQRKALSLGSKPYAENPKSLEMRLAHYWQ